MIKMKIFLSSPFLAENVNFLVQQTIFSLFFNFLEFCMSRAAKEAPHFIQRLSTCPEKNLKKNSRYLFSVCTKYQNLDWISSALYDEGGSLFNFKPD